MNAADLHGRLIAKQTVQELERKARKAVTRSNVWTQEELDAADRQAYELSRFLNGETPP